jgi:hypothetical protein
LKENGVSLLVPLLLGKRLVGILGLSRSRYGASFDPEDLALIRTIAKQAAGCFMSAQLSERILRSKELETFHLFSTFVIHDLKNFVSMLSLIARNMGNNFNNPVFQRDAMTSISRIAEKMQRMMVRLSSLSEAPLCNKAETDVNGMIRELMEEMKETIPSRVVAEYGELPRIKVDPEQMKNVIRNLLMNADEATSDGGEIRLSTDAVDGNITITVSDNGCGIPREYMEKELFALFSTTKSDGLGIGLYQSKRIVESHGGRIKVESEVGRGSTFRVLLPVIEV